MTTNEIKFEVTHLISELFKENGFDTDIVEYTDLIDDMGLDSITFISIVVELESQFNITIPDNMLIMDNFRNVDDIVEIIEQKLTQPSAEMEGNSDDKT